ncbi:MAG: hypothetical protein JXR49_22235, partial [Acidobacteria bacterium]|nr:hypothetical protein [Acidobacteriota bacterium]
PIIYLFLFLFILDLFKRNIYQDFHDFEIALEISGHHKGGKIRIGKVAHKFSGIKDVGNIKLIHKLLSEIIFRNKIVTLDEDTADKLTNFSKRFNISKITILKQALALMYTLFIKFCEEPKSCIVLTNKKNKIVKRMKLKDIFKYPHKLI